MGKETTDWKSENSRKEIKCKKKNLRSNSLDNKLSNCMYSNERFNAKYIKWNWIQFFNHSMRSLNKLTLRKHKIRIKYAVLFFSKFGGFSLKNTNLNPLAYILTLSTGSGHIEQGIKTRKKNPEFTCLGEQDRENPQSFLRHVDNVW